MELELFVINYNSCPILHNIKLPYKNIFVLSDIFFILREIANMATTKKKPGRPKKKDKDKVKVKHIYITDDQEKKIISGHKSLTLAILAKCG